MESNELKKKNIQTSREEIDYGSVNLRKVAVISCGFVGSASAFALMQSGMFSEMVLIETLIKQKVKLLISVMEHHLPDL